MALTQLIYVSSAARNLDQGDIRRMLESCVRHNLANQVTGMLLFASGNFLQVLEGEEDAVDETMSRILLDHRHHGVIVISKETVTDRDFPTWLMGFRGVGATDAKTWPGYAPYFESGFNASAIGAKPGLALELLKTFAKSNS
jgi:hypothetical protein